MSSIKDSLMTIETFFELQRQRVSAADGSDLDRQVRRLMFKNAIGEKTHTPDESPIHTGHYDSVKAGYSKLRLLYE